MIVELVLSALGGLAAHGVWKTSKKWQERSRIAKVPLPNEVVVHHSCKYNKACEEWVPIFLKRTEGKNETIFRIDGPIVAVVRRPQQKWEQYMFIVPADNVKGYLQVYCDLKTWPQTLNRLGLGDKSFPKPPRFC
jgi:hypothetical protein